MRIFLDANILFSAALPNSRLSELLMAIGSEAQFLTNEYAIEEARRNLMAKAEKAARSLEKIVSSCQIVSQLPASFSSTVQLPSKDVPILGGAIAGRATHLLTGDQRDFGKFWGKTIEGVKVVSPRMLADELGLL